MIINKDERLWDLYTRKEEYCNGLTDIHGRFPHYLSSFREIFEPVVSKTIVEGGLKLEYPGGKKFAVCLTHDIDNVFPSKGELFYQTFRSLKEGRLVDGLKAPFSRKIKKWNSLWNFRDCMALEEKYDAMSTFFFMAADTDLNNVNYQIGDVGEELKSISDNGWEVGLHVGYYSYDDPEKILLEKAKLEKALSKRVKGSRNHYLRFKTPHTWELLSRAGLEYDSTLGYADCVGFRNGMCHPFKPFNLEAGKEIDIIEIPLTIMDGTLFDYMRLDERAALSITKTLIDTVEKYHGVITILWHNSNLIGNRLKFYEQILRYCHEKNAFMSSCERVAEIFREQSFNSSNIVTS